MPTNDERREVAAKLREPFDVLPQGGYYHASHTLFGMGLYTSSEDALRLGVRRLADLIEPEERTCRIYDTDHGVEDSIRCDACQMTFRRPWQPFKFCPNCGARVIQE